MNVFVVYQSHWGNTATIAKAIAEGFGPDARAVTTDDVSKDAIAEADLIVAGAPVMAFGLPAEKMRDALVAEAGKAPSPPDLSHTWMRSWLDQLPRGNGRSASFETRIWWSPGGSTKAMDRGLERAGFRTVAKAQRFVVQGTYGPLREGELERAREWGAELARLMAT